MSAKAIRLMLNIVSGLFGIVMIVLGISDSNRAFIMLGIWFTGIHFSDVLMSVENALSTRSKCNKHIVINSVCANKQCVLRPYSGRCAMIENCDSFKSQTDL